jgi:DNA-binding transcriptional regulator YhcF (GntR family)
MTIHNAEIFALDHHTQEPIYRQLMNEMLAEAGVLEHVRGRSVQVARSDKATVDERIKLLEPTMERLILAAGQLGIEHSALLDEFTRLLGRRQ